MYGTWKLVWFMTKNKNIDINYIQPAVRQNL